MKRKEMELPISIKTDTYKIQPRVTPSKPANFFMNFQRKTSYERRYMTVNKWHKCKAMLKDEKIFEQINLGTYTIKKCILKHLKLLIYAEDFRMYENGGWYMGG